MSALGCRRVCELLCYEVECGRQAILVGYGATDGESLLEMGRRLFPSQPLGAYWFTQDCFLGAADFQGTLLKLRCGRADLRRGQIAVKWRVERPGVGCVKSLDVHCNSRSRQAQKLLSCSLL